MSNDLQQITPFDGYGADAGEFANSTALARPMQQQGGGGGGEPAPAGGGLIKRIHNSLRGRYWIAILVGALLGGAGGYFGYRSQYPVYRAEATLRFVQNKEIGGMPGSTASAYIPNFEELLQSEALVMISRRIIADAIKSPEWKNTKLPDDSNNPILIGKLAKDLSADHPSRSEIIRAYYMDRDPGVAAAVVRAITMAYESYKRTGRVKGNDQRIQVLDAHRATLRGKIERLEKAIRDAADRFGTSNLDSLYENKLPEVEKLASRVREGEILLANVKSKKDARESVEALTPNQIAMMDQVMRNMIVDRDRLESDMARLRASNIGEQHNQMKQLRAMYEQIENKIIKYTAEWKELQRRLPEEPALGAAAGVPRLLQLSAKHVEAEVETLRAKHKQLNDELLLIGRTSLEIKDLERQKENLQTDVRDTSRVITNAEIESVLGDRLQIVSYGEVPVAPFKDRRKMFGAAGALGGFGLPLFLLICIGLMDKRYRYSDEANDGISNVPLLGILPRLPDKLTDPEQAAVAAHCIHQIRIMLQVGGDPEKRRVFMITSASTGDGKTSLTMALGLSFAASGSKTLVIDCDMVGQGLTHRLKAHDVPGLIETLNLGTLRGHVRKTATKGLYLLPIGNADQAHAGVLSPQSINRLLAACREHFDVIVIDTGPILGSLEASVVAAESDGVIIAVARGQKQPLVEKAIKHLRTIGSHIFGIVFNRAEQRDFQRSVASASIRSLSARPHEPRALLTESEESQRFGPLANSVASCLPPAEGQGRGNGEA